MQEVEAICEKVVIIHQGRIVAQDLLRNLKSDEGEYTLILETEEYLELEWFGGLEFEKINPQHPNTFVFTCNKPKELRKSLLALVQEKNLNLISIRQQEKNLESVFYRLTQS
jgi:ABC-2 type transport system ATP-binding protein